jgi:hypothetical protein
MERVHHCAGSSFVTTDAVAEALLEYAREVAETTRTELVEVPTTRDDGSAGRVRVLLNKETQLSAESITPAVVTLSEADFLRVTTRGLALLRSPAGPERDLDPHWPSSLEHWE